MTIPSAALPRRLISTTRLHHEVRNDRRWRSSLAFARNALSAGHEVVLSNRHGPESLVGKVAEHGRRASAGTVGEAASLDALWNVRFWHKADMAIALNDVRFWG
jgi:hypothetical protein